MTEKYEDKAIRPKIICLCGSIGPSLKYCPNCGVKLEWEEDCNDEQITEGKA
jgi:hypothetical protein